MYTRRAVFYIQATVTVEIRHEGLDPDTLDEEVSQAAQQFLESSALTYADPVTRVEIQASVDGMTPDEETDKET